MKFKNLSQKVKGKDLVIIGKAPCVAPNKHNTEALKAFIEEAKNRKPSFN